MLSVTAKSYRVKAEPQGEVEVCVEVAPVVGASV